MVCPADLVVDLGCGTGLSLTPWLGGSQRVIGIDPDASMLALARRLPGWAKVEVVAGYGEAIPLDKECVDLVTCAQSLHWMEPVATMAEVARILRSGGHFVAYDYRWPPRCDAPVEAAVSELLTRVASLSAERGFPRPRWSRERQQASARSTGAFSDIRHARLTTREVGDAKRLLGMLSSGDELQWLLANGVDEELLGLRALADLSRGRWGDQRRSWHFDVDAWFMCKVAR